MTQELDDSFFNDDSDLDSSEVFEKECEFYIKKFKDSTQELNMILAQMKRNTALRDKIKDYQDKREDFDYFINVQWENWKKEYKEKAIKLDKKYEKLKFYSDLIKSEYKELEEVGELSEKCRKIDKLTMELQNSVERKKSEAETSRNRLLDLVILISILNFSISFWFYFKS
ncbi:hypothetical protein CONCODRAFT_78007 [Conidiobolus coronatus NRRL 28638]|uniref:Uncharacterized protein n=1 Tax=Conidiobolus coronatus (strain ATCC 28846 / CBS 209.66 / NRRL 28638) TaxID=796925 RepID=A0A137PAM1_CONC2|nr:hypothetical protein CONCODRAFT_78007 [Conidiobolus coronatus NRRL 28638]|eukprot:KXN72046.1 hypothetical protein CONCODRAFT_78007 [Conidiobolus coronatus NRRL 28638]